jgi:hypothetical protein
MPACSAAYLLHHCAKYIGIIMRGFSLYTVIAPLLDHPSAHAHVAIAIYIWMDMETKQWLNSNS